MFELAKYFEMVSLEILPSAKTVGFPIASHMCTTYVPYYFVAKFDVNFLLK